jgi:hypothetical protein
MKALTASSDTAFLEILSNRRVQARLSSIYRGYRKEIKVQSGSPESAIAAELARAVHGRRNAPLYSDAIADELANWLKAPARHPLPAATLQALALPLLSWEAYREAFSPQAGGRAPKRKRATTRE